MQATATGCKPLLEDQAVSSAFHRVSERQSTCQSLMSHVYKDYLPAHRVDSLLIAARWTPQDLDALRGTLKLTARLGLKVILFGPMVEYDVALPRLLAISIQKNDLSIPPRHLLSENWILDTQMARLARSEQRVKYVSLIMPICEQHECALYAGDGVPLEFDSNHLTREGSLVVAQRIKVAGSL